MYVDAWYKTIWYTTWCLSVRALLTSILFMLIDDSSTEEGSGNINFGDADIQSCCKLFLGIQNCYYECINVSGTRHNRGWAFHILSSDTQDCTEQLVEFSVKRLLSWNLCKFLIVPGVIHNSWIRCTDTYIQWMFYRNTVNALCILYCANILRHKALPEMSINMYIVVFFIIQFWNPSFQPGYEMCINTLSTAPTASTTSSKSMYLSYI